MLFTGYASMRSLFKGYRGHLYFDNLSVYGYNYHSFKNANLNRF